MNDDVKTKLCPNCKETKPFSMFYKNSSKASGYKSHCKVCCKKYREENKDYFKNYSSKYRKLNLEYFRKKAKKFRENNPNYYKELKSTEEYKQRVNSYNKNKRKIAPMFKLQSNLRNRIHGYILQTEFKKNKKTEELLGANFDKVKSHIESTFQKGMNWNNNGRCQDGNCGEVWHIDHIVPLVSATTEEELYELFHYTNLQALWAFDNLSKGCN